MSFYNQELQNIGKIIAFGGLELSLNLKLDKRDIQILNIDLRNIKSLQDLSFLIDNENIWEKIYLSTKNELINTLFHMNRVKKIKNIVAYLIYDKIEFTEEQKKFQKILDFALLNNGVVIYSYPICKCKINIGFNLIYKNNTIKINLYGEKEENSEINTDNKNMIDAHKNFGDWLGTEEGRFVLISLSNYLDSKSKYSLFSSKKSYINFLYRHIEDKYTEFKENNKINPNSNSIQEKINEIKQSNDDTHKFNLSIGTLKALELLNNEEHLKFFTSEKYDSFSDDIYLVYKIIFQLTPFNEIKNSENKKIFFENMIKYVENCAKNEEKSVGQIFKEIVKKFEFNKDNILDVKNMILGNEDKLKPKFYSKICKTTGLIIFLIKDIFEYLGFNNNNNKCSPAVILANLEFLEKMKAKIPNYLKFLKQFT